MSAPSSSSPKSPTSHLHVMNLIVATLAGILSITGGIYSLKNNFFSGPATGSLRGVVRDERIAKPLRLALVEISAVDGAVVNTANTDDEGQYVIEALKTGNYAVKFTAPFHEVATKTVKIEKDLSSTINVELIPDEQKMRAALNASENFARPNIPAVPYSAPGPQVQMPATSSYGSNQNNPQEYAPSSQTGGVSDYGAQNPGYRRHPRHNYPEQPVDNPSGTSQAPSQGAVLAEAGTQLLQAWLSKKSEQPATPATTSTASTATQTTEPQ